MKTERNEPCPCGSGKKYKKCCLPKDEQIALDAIVNTMLHNEAKVDEWEPEDNMWEEIEEQVEEDDFNDEEPEMDDDDDDVDDEDDDEEVVEEDDEDEDEDEDDDDVEEEEEEEVQKISNEEMKLVDEWWKKYKKMKDTVEEREHLRSFINLYPHLVDHLELYHEVLFEMGSNHYRRGIYETFVELLLKIRDDYPITYRESFEYYDSYLIFWFTAQRRIDEIGKFFDYFKEDGRYSDKLADLIDFFHAINRSDILLMSFSGSKVFKHISWIISNNIIQKYLYYPVTDESIQSMIDEFEKEGVRDEDDTIESLKELLLDYTRPFTPWSDKLPMKRSQADSYYNKIYKNFAYFLCKKTELSFSSAYTFAITIYEYYNRIVGQENRPADTFSLDEKSIINYLIKNYDTTFWGYQMQCFIALNAFYHFVDYLNMCGNISEEQKNSVQEMLTNIYQKAYEISKYQGPEMLLFVKFPLWTIKK